MEKQVIIANEPWWKFAVGYQIYPASFCDSNGDGIGDIPGIISKLPYLAELGIGFIWLSPVYASPMVDHGYDISDYQAINPIFGTMADMERLIAEARDHSIGIVMDLVVNHTSDQHAWFQTAIADPSCPYRDYYIWRDTSPEPSSPAAIESTFGGPAWTKDEASGQYYFHLFAPQQPDLNWANPALRADVYAMMNWWLNKGIAGFRMDVIDLIGKEPENGIAADGPMVHAYLQEMHAATFAGRDVMTVGETWSATPENAPLYSDPARRELSMVFQFEHVTRLWDESLGKWGPKPVDWVALKSVFARWQTALHGKGWNSLFWGNHDLPRCVSRYGDDAAHRVASAKALATVLHMMEGTPFVFQGEEIGMTNVGFKSIDQYHDVETLNFYTLQMAAGMAEEAFLAGARANSRDNARTPMQWTAKAKTGFTDGEPWISINPNCATINVEESRADPDGVFHHYRRLITLRRAHPIIRSGRFTMLCPEYPNIVAYLREFEGQRLLVLANMAGEAAAIPVDLGVAIHGHDLLTQQRIALAVGDILPAYAQYAIVLQDTI